MVAGAEKLRDAGSCDQLVYEQPLKSISAAVVVAPGVTLSGAGGVLVSMLTVWKDGEHIAALVVGFVASASTV